MREDSSHLIISGLFSMAFIGIVLYSNILNAPFIFDDYSSIVENESVKKISQSLKNISSNRYLTSLSFALNYAIGGLNPFGYHLINNLIHVINTILVYYLVILTFRTPYFSEIIYTPGKSPHPPFCKGGRGGINFIAFSSAFVFISHPIQTQAVTYIAQRAASMATMFYLFSLVMYIKFRIQQSALSSQQSELHATRYTLYAISLVSAILAMKTKEIAFTLPVVIALYEFSFFNKTPVSQFPISNLKRFLYLLPILLTLLIIPLSMLNFKVPIETITQDINIQSRETVNISRTDYLLTQFRVIITYLRLLIFPVNQNIDYTFPIYHSFFDLQVLLSFLLLLSIFSIAVYFFYASRVTHNGLRLMAFGIFWFFITLSVESSIIPIKDVIFEHRIYLPSIGVFIAFISSIEYFIRQQKVKILTIVVIVAILSIATFNRNLLWNDPQALWEDVLVKFPNNVRAHNDLGVISKEQEEYDKALIRFEKVLKINPNYFPAYYNIGDIHYRLGNYKIALAYFVKVLKLKPSYHFHLDTLNSLAITYSEMGDDDKAVNAYKEAIQVFPLSVIPYNNLGRQYIKMEKFDLAIEILERGLEIREEPHLRSNLSLAQAKKMQRDKNNEKARQ